MAILKSFHLNRFIVDRTNYWQKSFLVDCLGVHISSAFRQEWNKSPFFNCAGITDLYDTTNRFCWLSIFKVDAIALICLLSDWSIRSHNISLGLLDLMSREKLSIWPNIHFHHWCDCLKSSSWPDYPKPRYIAIWIMVRFLGTFA